MIALPRFGVLFFSVALCAACGGASVHQPNTQQSLVDDRSRELAPDLAARVDRAEADALASDDSVATADHRERVQLWHVALEQEVARINADRQRIQLGTEIEAIETARVADETERQALEARTKRAQAAAIARNEAARIWGDAETDEAKRRGGDAARVDARRDASRALLDRSEAIVAAAVALGVDEATTSVAREAIASARRSIDGSARNIDAATKAFSLAQRALGEARARRPASNAQELASLVEALQQLGLSADALDEGVMIWLPDLFTGARAELRASSKALLANLAAVLSAHPHGPVQVQAIASGAVTRSIANQRAQRIKASLALVSDRISIVDGARSGDSDNIAAILLPAYASTLQQQR